MFEVVIMLPSIGKRFATEKEVMIFSKAVKTLLGEETPIVVNELEDLFTASGAKVSVRQIQKAVFTSAVSGDKLPVAEPVVIKEIEPEV